MSGIIQIIAWEVQLFLFALFAIVALQLLTGQINLKGLLFRKEGDGAFSPERVQLLLATIASAFQYLSIVLKDPTHFPNVPQNWLLLFGSSHAFYLGRKFYVSRPRQHQRS